MKEVKKYRLGNQPMEYELSESYLGWNPGNKEWEDLAPKSTITIFNPGTNSTQKLFLHHIIIKDAFPIAFFAEKRSQNWHRFAIVSYNETSEKFIIPLH